MLIIQLFKSILNAASPYRSSGDSRILGSISALASETRWRFWVRQPLTIASQLIAATLLSRGADAMMWLANLNQNALKAADDWNAAGLGSIVVAAMLTSTLLNMEAFVRLGVWIMAGLVRIPAIQAKQLTAIFLVDRWMESRGGSRPDPERDSR
ncbi:hypothetical protein [Agromyces subbeticus]|uniref:hypothetical protein n=1 Tax=Agromyces subbeticus TaxID=293890 RepID=UPI0003B6118B|nr:hypothetical protein [Agromyces subbeticus]